MDLGIRPLTTVTRRRYPILGKALGGIILLVLIPALMISYERTLGCSWFSRRRWPPAQRYLCIQLTLSSS